jgi:signal recognition particle receptor subunit beta
MGGEFKIQVKIVACNQFDLSDFESISSVNQPLKPSVAQLP